MRRQPDFSTVRRPSRRRAWESVAAAAALVAALLVAFAAVGAREEAAEAAARRTQTRAEVDQLRARLAALSAHRSSSGAAGSASPAHVVAAIAAALPADARLERLAIDYLHGTAIEMQVVTRSPAAWDRLLARLESSPQLREVAPGPESRQDEMRSVVRARWAGGTPR